MRGLVQGEKIYIGAQEYILTEQAKEKEKSGFSIWVAVAESAADGRRYFLKYTPEHSREGKILLDREGQFQMYYPYIERVYGVFHGETEDGERLYVVVAEYIEGVDLKTYRERTCRHLNERKMFRYMMQMLYGVQYYIGYTKEDPYIHRDLKPENIMIDARTERAVIIDFDWAHITKSRVTSEEQKRNGTVLGGTRGYSDPRAYQENVTADLKMDIYALGRTFCFFVRGVGYFQDAEEEVYTEEDCGELAYGVKKDRIPEKYQDEVYRKFWEIIGRMTAKPEERYCSVSEIIEDMKEFLITYYGGVEACRDIFCDRTVLRTLGDRYIGKKITVGYCVSSNGRRILLTLAPYAMADIEIANIPVMSVYHLDGAVYYVPISPELQKERETGTYRIENGDKFRYKGDCMDIMVR